MKPDQEKTVYEEHMKKNDLKIDELSKQVSDLLHEFREYREETAPMLALYKDSRGFYNTFTNLLKLMALVGAGVGAVLFLKKL